MCPSPASTDAPDTTGPSALQLAGLFALSAAALAFEVLLLRLFEFSHWHHFAGFAISLALLGFGTAGTVIALLGARAARWGDGGFLAGLIVTAAGLLLVLVVQSRVALRPLFAAWDAGELALLLLVDISAFLPFLGVGLAIGQAFVRWPHRARRLYAANLLGSGAGSVAGSVLLAQVSVESALALWTAVLPLLGAGLALPQRRWLASATCLALFALGLAYTLHPPNPAVSDFKALSRLRELPDARILREQPGLPGRLTLIRSQSIRFAPGLSLQWPQPIPPQDAAVIGSDHVVPLPYRYPPPSQHLAASLAGLPLSLRRNDDVLVLGSGSWQAVPDADTVRFAWVDADSRLLAIARQRGAGTERLPLVHDALYRHLAVSSRRHDVIVLSSAYDGGDAASEDYLMTAEGLALALGRLRPRGLLALPLQLNYPPRHFPRALTTLQEALERQGAKSPGDHVAVLRGLQALLILASPEPLTGDDRRAIRRFAEDWGFDLVWAADLTEAETNRRHRLEAPLFFASAKAVFDAEPLPAVVTWFATEPATLARPYFWRSLEWLRAPDFLRALGPRGLVYLDWTLVLSAVTALVVVVLAFALILAPLGRLPTMAAPYGRGSVAVYFTALGLGYMLLELALFQRLVLFIGEPVASAAFVFAVFLIGSGLGSASAPEVGGRRAVTGVFAAVTLGVAIASLTLFSMTQVLLTLPLAYRLVALIGLIVPLAWALGRPLPWALRQLTGQPRWLPWAWGINGFASVTGATLAPLLSVHHGQPATFATGALCYAVAFAVARHWTAPRGRYGRHEASPIMSRQRGGCASYARNTMDTDEARESFESGRLTEAVVEPADNGNGWILLVRLRSGELVTITDHSGEERIYHDLDHVTELARDIGFAEVRVEERF